MSAFFRFPRTPHLVWLGPGKPRGDKVLSAEEAATLLAHDVVVEEKVDGANLGISVDEWGTVRAQNRGAFVALDGERGQFSPLGRWLRPRLTKLADALAPDLILFGEWCYAVHGVKYTRLPDWFLAFDVYDRARAEFWSAERRDALTATLGIASVPRLDFGRFGLSELVGMLGQSRLAADGTAEGLYIRRDVGERLVFRAKLVRPEFVQAMDDHWSRKRLRTNTLVAISQRETHDRGR